MAKYFQTQGGNSQGGNVTINFNIVKYDNCQHALFIVALLLLCMIASDGYFQVQCQKIKTISWGKNNGTKT
jgi:hypothetical protein